MGRTRLLTWRELDSLRTLGRRDESVFPAKRQLERDLLELRRRKQRKLENSSELQLLDLPCDKSILTGLLVANSEPFRAGVADKDGWMPKGSSVYRLHHSVALETKAVLALLKTGGLLPHLPKCGLPPLQIAQFLEKCHSGVGEEIAPVIYDFLLKLGIGTKRPTQPPSGCTLEPWRLEAVGTLLRLNTKGLPNAFVLEMLDVSLGILAGSHGDGQEEGLEKAQSVWLKGVARSLGREILNPAATTALLSGALEFGTALGKLDSTAQSRRGELLLKALQPILDKRTDPLPTFAEALQKERSAAQANVDPGDALLAKLKTAHPADRTQALLGLTSDPALLRRPSVREALHSSLTQGLCPEKVADSLLQAAADVRSARIFPQLQNGERPALFLDLLDLGLKAFGRLPFAGQENVRTRAPSPIRTDDTFGQTEFRPEVNLKTRVMQTFNKLLDGGYQEFSLLSDVSGLVLQCPSEVVSKAIQDGVLNRHAALLTCQVLRRFRGLCSVKGSEGRLVLLDTLRRVVGAPLVDFQVQNLRVLVRGLYAKDINSLEERRFGREKTKATSLVEFERVDFERVEVSPGVVARAVLVPLLRSDCLNARAALHCLRDLFEFGLDRWDPTESEFVLRSLVELCRTKPKRKALGTLANLSGAAIHHLVSLIASGQQQQQEESDPARFAALLAENSDDLWTSVLLLPLGSSDQTLATVLERAWAGRDPLARVVEFASVTDKSCDLASLAMRKHCGANFERTTLSTLQKVATEVTPQGLLRLLTRFLRMQPDGPAGYEEGIFVLDLIGRFAYRFCTRGREGGQAVLQIVISAVKSILGKEPQVDLSLAAFRLTCQLLARAERSSQPSDSLFLLACHLVKLVRTHVDKTLDSRLQDVRAERAEAEGGDAKPGPEEKQSKAEEKGDPLQGVKTDDLEDKLKLARLELTQLPGKYSHLLARSLKSLKLMTL